MRLIDNSFAHQMDDGGWALSKNVVAQIETQPQSRSLPGSGQKFLASHLKTVGQSEQMD